MAVPRRRMNTYGKQSRKMLVHDLFEVAEPSLRGPARPELVEKIVPEGTQTPSSDVSEDPEASFQLKRDLLNAINSTSKVSNPPSHTSRSPSVAASSAPSMFEIESSDEELPRPRLSRPVYKKRKISPPSSDNDRSARAATTGGRSNIVKASGPKSTSEFSSKEKVQSLSSKEKIAQSEAEKKSRTIPLAPSPSRTNRQMHTSSVPRTPLKQRKSPTPTENLPSTPAIGSPVSDHSSASMVSTRSMKRKRREAEDAASSFSSPSRLPLSSLTLTSQRRAVSRPRSVQREESGSPSADTPSKKRLIDRLDVSKSRTEANDAEVTKGTPSDTSVQSQRRRPDSCGDATQPIVSTKGSTETSPRKMVNVVDETIRPRKYGKQRSHLKGMVDNLPSQSVASSQSSLRQLESQIDALTKSQPSYDMDLDLEDDEPGSQLKSIHELRQAGAVDRFDSEFDDSMENIESQTKALRIHGLMTLIRKLQEQAFKRRMLESGKFRRLLLCVRADLDTTSCALFLICLWTAVNSDAATQDTISEIYAALLQLQTGIIRERRSLSQIVRDRQENLSKALTRDLIEFEIFVLDQSSDGNRTSKSIVPSVVAVRCMDFLSSRAYGVPIPRKWFEAVIDAIIHHASRTIRGDDPAEHIESIRLLALWLKHSVDSSSSLSSALGRPRLEDLGNTIAELLAWSLSNLEQMQAICLRLVAELCSHDDVVSEVFTLTDIPFQANIVIIHYFPRIGVTRADQNQEQLESESLMAAFACLLNFAQNSSIFRRGLLATEAGREQLEELVGFSKQHLHHVEEVTDDVETQSLLPFGFLLLLLCLLCLETDVRNYITDRVGSKALGGMVSQAEIFLHSLSTIGEGAFVERFRSALEEVRRESPSD